MSMDIDEIIAEYRARAPEALLVREAHWIPATFKPHRITVCAVCEQTANQALFALGHLDEIMHSLMTIKAERDYLRQVQAQNAWIGRRRTP